MDPKVLGKPKLGRQGDPGVVKIGGDDHGGHGYLNGVIDDYPVKYGLRVSDPGKGSAYRVRKGK